MTEREWLAERFEEHRTRLRAVAYRMLGSVGEADDAVQEAWLRLRRQRAGEIENVAGWLTTVVGRVALNMLRSRGSRPESPVGVRMADPSLDAADGPDPEHEALIADSAGLALLVVLDTLSPPERLSFVLHDLFGLPFEDIAPIVERSVPATRQLASRARGRVCGAAPRQEPGGSPSSTCWPAACACASLPSPAAGACASSPSPACQHRRVSESNVELARRGWEAAQRGDLDVIGELLDPDVKWHGGDPESGCQNRVQTLEFMRRAAKRRALPELVDVVGAGDKVAVIMARPSEQGGKELVANLTTFRDGKVVEMVHYPDANDALAAVGA